MSKRDEDQSDMEVGMTTAERRRRRRRGGGLRVPSDNVPRRASTAPPVVAPVPEDPALAMSIAYSFTAEPSEPVPRVDLRPGTVEDEATAFTPMSTVIDPPSGPIEPIEESSFEMKTREMSAVDLEALGISENGATRPTQRQSSDAIETSAKRPVPKSTDSDALMRFRASLERPAVPAPEPPPPVAPRPVKTEIDVDIAALEATTLDTTLPSTPEPSVQQTLKEMLPQVQDEPRTPRVRDRIQTVALSDDDLEEVREAVRAISQAKEAPVDKANKTEEPLSVPEIDIQELSERADASDGEFEVDVEDETDEKAAASPPWAPLPPAAPILPAVVAAPVAPERPRPPSQPPPLAPTAHPPPAPPARHSGTKLGTDPPRPRHESTEPPPPVVVAPPPPPLAAVLHKSPPAPPPKKAPPPPIVAAVVQKPSSEKPARGKPWFTDLFDEDYLRTLPFLTPQATQAEAEFVVEAMGLTAGAQVLDVGCGYGRHAMELAARGFHVVGLDLSTPLLVRGGEEANRRGLTINFVRGDMRELDFDAQFDGAYCLFSTFGYFDDETNKKTIANIARALKPGGKVMIEILNRDYVIADLPTRVWWEGEGCVVLEEVELNYFSSRIQVNRSVVFDDGRQLEQEISVRAYSLHEVGKLMHAAGFRVLEVSGGYQTRGRFFGNQSRHIIVLAERKDSAAT